MAIRLAKPYSKAKNTVKDLTKEVFTIKDSCAKIFQVKYVPETKKWHCNGSTTFYGYSFKEVQERLYKN